MPANLPPQYIELRNRVKSAKSDEERLALLNEMMATIPKHKGTEKLQKELKTRIAKIKKSTEKSSSGKKSLSFAVPREGAGQIGLVGGPNAGKSSLLAVLTNATPEIATYPFTTTNPQPGMMHFEDVQIQLVDLPAIAEGFTQWWVFSIIRNLDIALLVVNLDHDECLENLDYSVHALSERKIELRQEVEDTYEENGIKYLKTTTAAVYQDEEKAHINLEIVQEFYQEKFTLEPISLDNEASLKNLVQKLYTSLNIIRVYTKQPGKPPDMKKPYTLAKGAMLEDLAEVIHKDFKEKLKFARIWGEGKFEGQRINRQHVLVDKDVVELHI